MHERATHIEVEAEVRYWEDAAVNGNDDLDGALIPGRDGLIWKAKIALADGQIEGWPEGTTASIHYKVCDQGEYWLSSNGCRVAKWAGNYVPDAFLCHGDDARGYGDYIIMDVSSEGIIADYKRPTVEAEQWPLLAVA